MTIEDIRTGDRVESVNDSGELIFSDVIMIMHQVRVVTLHMTNCYIEIK